MRQNKKNKHFLKIAIFKTATHPALDTVIKSFVSELKQQDDQEIVFIEKNAEGSITAAHTIAQQFFHDKSVDLFFTVGTLATQSMIIQEKNRPVFFTAVSYPGALGLFDDQQNVCGISDAVSVDYLFQVLAYFFPSKKVGVIYTAGESNSLSIIEEMQKKAGEKKILLFPFIINAETDIPLVVQSMCKKCDVILLPTDNTVASSVSLIAKIALQHMIPLFMTDISLMRYGGTCGVGVDYSVLGVKAAKLVHLISRKMKSPFQIGFTAFEDKTVYINKKLFEQTCDSRLLHGVHFKYYDYEDSK